MLGHIVVLFSVFWETSITFPTVGAPIYIPTNSGKVRFSPLPHQHLLFAFCVYVCVRVRVCSWWKPFWQMWGDITLWFWFVFLWWLAMVSIFSYASWPSSFPLWKNVYSVLLLISKTYLSLIKDNFFTFHFFNIYFYLTVLPGLSYSTRDQFSCSSWTLSCSRWDLVPWPGMEPRAPALGPQSLSHWNSREVLSSFFFFFLSSCLWGNLYSTFCLYKFTCSGNFYKNYIETYNICLAYFT